MILSRLGEKAWLRLDNLGEILDSLKSKGVLSLRGLPTGARGNLGSQTKGLRTVLAKANLVLQPCWRMCWRSQSRSQTQQGWRMCWRKPISSFQKRRIAKPIV